MNLSDATDIIEKIQQKIDSLPVEDLSSIRSTTNEEFIKQIDECISTSTTDPIITKRIRQEFFEWGPIESLLADPEITEIIICNLDKISYEKAGKLSLHSDRFLSYPTFRIFLRRLCHEAGVELSIVAPFLHGRWRDFRVQIVCEPISAFPTIHLRRIRVNHWSLDDLIKMQMLSNHQAFVIRQILVERKNILVVGGTGSGKTTILNALLGEIPKDERIVIIEDANELIVPNSVSSKMLTRFDPQQKVPDIDQSQLVKQSLRMRPDRVVVGEVRGAEAKDLILALSTGHAGSIGTLHADGPRQALLRLEMLVSLGAPQWQTDTIRQMIKFGIDVIIVIRREPSGHRHVDGVYQITSLEEYGLVTERIDSSHGIENKSFF